MENTYKLQNPRKAIDLVQNPANNKLYIQASQKEKRGKKQKPALLINTKKKQYSKKSLIQRFNIPICLKRENGIIIQATEKDKSKCNDEAAVTLKVASAIEPKVKDPDVKEEATRIKEEAAKKKKKEEAEEKEEEAAKKKKEKEEKEEKEEAAKKEEAEEEARRIKAEEEEARRIKAEEEARRIKAEEEEEARRIKAEEETIAEKEKRQREENEERQRREREENEKKRERGPNEEEEVKKKKRMGRRPPPIGPSSPDNSPENVYSRENLKSPTQLAPSIVEPLENSIPKEGHVVLYNSLNTAMKIASEKKKSEYADKNNKAYNTIVQTDKNKDPILDFDRDVSPELSDSLRKQIKLDATGNKIVLNPEYKKTGGTKKHKKGKKSKKFIKGKRGKKSRKIKKGTFKKYRKTFLKGC